MKEEGGGGRVVGEWVSCVRQSGEERRLEDDDQQREGEWV